MNRSKIDAQQALKSDINSSSKVKNKRGATQLDSTMPTKANKINASTSTERLDISEEMSEITSAMGAETTPDQLLNFCQNAPVLSADELTACAKQMEHSRALLTNLLIEHEQGLVDLAKEFIRQNKLGSDLSELVNKSFSESNDPVQNENVVQDTAKQLESKLLACFEPIIGHSNSPEQQNEVISFLKEIHFLPNFLKQVSANFCRRDIADQELLEQINQHSHLMCHSRQTMINGNLRLVTFVARQYNSHSMTFLDLIQDGTVGLIKAVDRYDWQRSVRFSTYAIYWIKQTICRAMVRQEKVVRLPYNIAAKAAAVFETMNNFLNQNNKWPSSTELAALCQLPEEEIKAIITNYQPTVSLSSNVNNDEEMPEVEATIEQHHFPQPMNILANSALKNFLRQAVATLPEREADIINCRFGLDNNNEMTLQDIADKLSLTRERVRQIQNAALLKLKTNFSSDLSDFLEPG